MSDEENIDVNGPGPDPKTYKGMGLKLIMESESEADALVGYLKNQFLRTPVEVHKHYNTEYTE